MAPLWIGAGISVATIVASLRWAVMHRRQPSRVWVDLTIAFVGIVVLGFMIYGMLAFCEAPAGSACA